MKNTLKSLAQQLNANGVALDQVPQQGKTAITMAYLDADSLGLVAGGAGRSLPIGGASINFWDGPDNFCKVIS